MLPLKRGRASVAPAGPAVAIRALHFGPLINCGAVGAEHRCHRPWFLRCRARRISALYRSEFSLGSSTPHTRQMQS